VLIRFPILVGRLGDAGLGNVGPGHPQVPGQLVIAGGAGQLLGQLGGGVQNFQP
jgi:hypothetical protein